MSLFLSLVSTSAIAMLLQAIPATEAGATNPAQAEAKSEAKQEAKPEKPTKICRTIRNTGMRTLARQCKTQDQWEKSDSEAATDQDLQLKTGQLNPS